MLEPGQRRMFLETLRPPEGYLFDRAVGTTFTLDLMTLLAVPLAFTFRDAQDRDGRLASDPLALLESARQHASRIVVFCHGGHTAVPRAGQAALAFLEQSVVAAFPSRQGEAGAVFHPKLWVLRYVARDGPVRYRLVCQSRNLTFDLSWDSSLVLDGELIERRVRAYAVNHPLADFIRTLPLLAADPISGAQKETIDVFADELRRVRFETPEGLALGKFLPFGTSRRNPPFPDLEHRPLLVISPFLDGEFLRSIASPRPRAVLVSRREALLTVPANAVGAFNEVYAFRPGLEPEPEDSDVSLPPLAGLHAKVYVIDDGWDAHVIVGSANSTGAALANPPRNVEFMVELVGRKSRFGIDALLAQGTEGAAGTFRSLIEPFDPAEAGTVKEDEDALHLDRLLDAAAETLARVDLRASVALSNGGRYILRLELSEPLNLPSPIKAVTCWPATLPDDYQHPLKDGVEFTGLSLTELSAFLAIEIQASIPGRSARKRFARTIQLAGLPEDRLQRLLAGMLRDRTRLMQLLWLLLSPDADLSFGEFSELLVNEGVSAEWGVALPGLLERMLETLGSDPGRLDAVASLLDDLRKTEAGAKLVGAEFDAIWGALWTVRGRRP